jgi:HEPN domain-containing protein/predicted nucleotidyltransferase
MMVTYQDARKAAQAIRKAVHPYAVLLFGSVAREGQGNDLDLLVLFDDKEIAGKDVQYFVNKSLKPYYKKFSVDPFVLPLSKWYKYQKKGSPFLNLISKEGKVLFMKDIVEDWTRQAQEDLDMAKYLLKGGFFKGACYHAQQSAEKAMKASLFKKGWELEKTHSAARLAAIGDDMRVKFPLSEEDIVFLDSIYRGRYPLEAGLLPLGSPKSNEAEKAIALAGKLYKDITKKKR